MGALNCIAIKWGDLYSGEHVNRLYRAAKRRSARDVRFFCMTDRDDGLDPAIERLPLLEEPYEAQMRAALAQAPKQGALRKVAMFRPDLVPDLDGPMLALDIDIVITGALDDLADFAPGKVAMRRPFSPRVSPATYGEGSVIKFEPAVHAFLYEDMVADPEGAVRDCQGSEQTYTSTAAFRRGAFAAFPDAWIVSFKRHCRPAPPLNLVLPPRLPPEARVVCFHGRPKIDEARDGFRGKLTRSTRPARWIAENSA